MQMFPFETFFDLKWSFKALPEVEVDQNIKIAIQTTLQKARYGETTSLFFAVNCKCLRLKSMEGNKNASTLNRYTPYIYT